MAQTSGQPSARPKTFSTEEIIMKNQNYEKYKYSAFRNRLVALALALFALASGTRGVLGAQTIITNSLTIGAGTTTKILAGDTMIIMPGASVQVDGTLLVQGFLDNRGSVQNNSVLENSGTIINTNSAVFTNNGQCTNSNLFINNGGTISSLIDFRNTPTGRIWNMGGGTIQISSDFYNDGWVSNFGSLIENFYFGVFHNNPGGNLVNTSGATLWNEGLLDNLAYVMNEASIENIGGIIFNHAFSSITNRDTIYTENFMVNYGLIVNEDDARIVNEDGELVNTSHSLVVNRGWFANLSTADAGWVRNQGYFDNYDNGTFFNDQGSFLYNEDSGSFTNSGEVDNRGGVMNNATFNNNSVFQNTTGVMLNYCAGTFTNNALYDNVNGRVNNGGSLIDNGTWLGNNPIPIVCPP
jgi:hypothetical protein